MNDYHGRSPIESKDKDNASQRRRFLTGTEQSRGRFHTRGPHRRTPADRADGGRFRGKGKNGNKPANQQEIIGILANLAIQIYAMESAFLRALKAWEANPETAAVKVDLARGYLYDNLPLLEKLTRESLAFIFEGDLLSTQLAIAKRLCKYQPIDLIRLRRQITGRMLEAEKYVV